METLCVSYSEMVMSNLERDIPPIISDASEKLLANSLLLLLDQPSTEPRPEGFTS